MSHKNNPGPAGGPMTGDWTRRGFLGLAGGAVGATLLSACGLSSSGGGGSSNGKATKVTFFYSVGAGQDVVPKKVISALEAKHHGLTVASLTGGAQFPSVLSAYKANHTALVNAGVFTAAQMASGQPLGMFQELKADQVPRMSKADSSYALFGNLGVPFNTNLVGLIYRSDLIDPPTSWLDLLSPKYKGKVGLYDAPQGILLGGLWSVNQVLGGDPVTLDKGFEAFSKAAQQGQFSTIYNSNQTQFDAFQRGECVIGASIVATQATWAAQGAKIGYAPPTEGQLAVPLYMAVVNGGSKEQSADGLEFVNDMLTPANVAEYNKLTFAGSVFPDIPLAAEQASLPAFSAAASAKVMQVNWKQQATVQNQLLSRWNEDVKGKLKQ